MPIIIPTLKFGKCIEMKIFSLCMVVTIVYKVCTLSRKSIRFGGGLVYEFRYLHHCNSYHLKSRENDSYIMHASVLNNGPYKHPQKLQVYEYYEYSEKRKQFVAKEDRQATLPIF